MRTRHSITFELLERRDSLSGGSLVALFLASAGTAHASQPSAEVVSLEPSAGPLNAIAPSDPDPSIREMLSSSPSATQGRWDWLADTDWYVPVENLLAYTAPPD